MKYFILFSTTAFISGCTTYLVKEPPIDPKLQKYEAPALEARIQKEIQNKLDIRSAGMGMINPVSKKLFFSWGITGSRQVFRLNSPQGFPVQLTAGEDSTSLADITPDGKWLILSRDFNGEENPGIYLQNPEGGPLKVILHLPKVVTNYEFTSDDSKFIYFRSNQLDATSFALFRYEIPSGKIETLFSEKGTWSIADQRGDDLLLARYITNTAAEYFLWNLKDKKLVPVIGQNEKENYYVQFGTKKAQFLVTTNSKSDFKKVYWLENNNWTEISPKLSAEIEGSIDQARKHIYLSINDSGYTKLLVLNASTLKPVKIPEFKNADHVYAGTTSKDGNTVMLGIDFGNSPQVNYSYNFLSQKLTQWTLPSAPEANLSQFSKAELLKIPTRDGQQITAWVRKPKNLATEIATPIVVHFHGGPEGQSLPGFSVFSQMVIDAGFIFVEPNVRGSTGFGKKFLDSDNGPKRLNVITDIEDVSTFLKKNFAVSNKTPKIGVMGWSYGGYSTLIAMSKFTGSYDAGVALVGMSNLVTFLNNTAPYRRNLRTPEYGDPVQDLEALKKLSAMTYLDQIKNPLLIIQGANDPRVPASEALQMHEAMVKKKIPSKLIIFSDEGHGSQKRSNRVLELGHTIAWFQKYLN